MGYFPAVLGLAAVIGLIVFFWRQFGPTSGHAVGNRVAAHFGISRSVFYALLENGVRDVSSRDLLLSLERSGLSLEEIGVRLAPSLSRGIERLEKRFGPQDIYADAKVVVARLLAAAEPSDEAASVEG